MEVRSTAGQVAYRDACVYLMGKTADQTEREAVISLLEVQVEKQLSDEWVNLKNSFFFMTEGSSIHVIWKTLSHLLNELVESEPFQEMLTLKGVIDRKQVLVTSSGQFFILLESGFSDIAGELNVDPLDAPRLQTLVAAASAVGGEIRLTNIVSLAQWLSFHEMKLPENVGEVSKLLSFMKWDWSESDRIGHYWEYIRGHEDPSVVLTDSQCQEIRALKKTLSPGSQKLLGMLYKNVKSSLGGDISWENAGEVLAKIVDHPSSQTLARKYLDKLGWYGSINGEAVEKSDLSKLLITAIILDVFPAHASTELRNHLENFDLYEPWDTVDQPINIVRNRLEQYLLSNRKISGELVPLASHLLLADLAPAFLVKSIPHDLTVGSLGWVALSQAVAFLEMRFKGASRFMTYDQVMAFADAQALSSSMGLLQGLAAFDAIVDWGLVNEVITHDELEASAKTASTSAISAYERYVKSMAQGSSVWAEPPPSRKRIAREELEKAAPGCDFLEKRLLRHFSDKFNSGLPMSMLDLHIEGELQKQGWDWSKDKSLFAVYPGLVCIPPNQSLFEEATRKHHQKLHEALSSNIKLAMARMPAHDREIYEKNRISFFTVRPEIGKLVYPSHHSTGFTGVNNQPPVMKETQAQRDEATGRFGVIMYVSHGDEQYLCHEMHTLQGKLIRNDELGAFLHKANLPARLDFTGRLEELLPAVRAIKTLPVDLESYTHGIAPRENRTSRAVIEKLGSVAAATGEFEERRGTYQHFISPRLEDIAQFITAHRPLATIKEYTSAITELTEREQVRKTTEEVMTYIIDLVVPFKKCIEDIASGDKNRLADGIYGCSMDAIAIVFSVLGATSKILSIASRTVSLASKLASTGKFGLKLVVSTFNPIDGLPTAGYKLSKSLYKSGARLSQEGVRLVELATFQLRRLTGKASSVDLLKLDNVPQIGMGTWRPRGSSADFLDVCAITTGDRWYGINQFGRPWGKRLDFEWKSPFTMPNVRRELPASYVNHVLEQGMQTAARKIDNAIAALTAPSFKLRTDPVIGLFFGTTPQARDNLLAFLKVVRTDFAGWSPSNLLLEPLKDHSTTLRVEPLAFGKWKSAAAGHKANHRFLAVNPKNIDLRLNGSIPGYGNIADDLLHEMFRATAARRVAAIATAAADIDKGLNVAPLLNLGAARLAESAHEEGGARPIENADSCAIATALLSQVVTDYPSFSKNVSIVQNAVDNHAGKTIDSEVWLNLNTR
ncbi:hypothetical protein [Pseudomonas sp. HS6]|uniref:hypothetical protein n=1 Tax=Pseudomonas sp. HS6 TaxID=2850559 RepID=UPI00201942DB|nr:hypothetical protein [Pseudomonas sp. HS6]UQS16107.1 hypothetical protein JJN09_04380 [Pseudomonas sp. HS6]